MEELLNELIEKGRVPFWDKRITNVNWKMQYVWTYNWVFWSNHNVVQFWKSTREIVSKSSQLWQFVCENGMVNEWDVKNFVWQRYELNWFEPQYPLIHKWNVAEYRLIESALCDEDKLEQFLLDNIKIWE
jgi:hypothetical protein